MAKNASSCADQAHGAKRPDCCASRMSCGVIHRMRMRLSHRRNLSHVVYTTRAPVLIPAPGIVGRALRRVCVCIALVCVTKSPLSPASTLISNIFLRGCRPGVVCRHTKSAEVPHGNDSARRQTKHTRCVAPRLVHVPFHDRLCDRSGALEHSCSRAIPLAAVCARAQPTPSSLRHYPIELARRDRTLSQLRNRRQTISMESVA